MIKQTQLFILTIAAIFLSSCYNYKELQLLQDNKFLPTYEKANFEEYRIKVNDELIFRVITSDERMASLISPQGNSAGTSQNQISYRVFPDGTIDFPFIDSMKVAGMTISEATSAVELRIKEMIPDAVVKMGLNNRTFTIFGDVGSGIFPIIKDKTTIFQALAMAGDFNDESDRRHVRIIRETDKGTVILNFDIRPKTIIDSKYYYVYPNDIIYVRKNFSGFYKISNYSTLINVVSFSVSLLFNVLIFNK